MGQRERINKMSNAGGVRKIGIVKAHTEVTENVDRRGIYVKGILRNH